MSFEDILNNGKLWATVYDGQELNILSKTFADWRNQDYLKSFFTDNKEDLFRYFRITNIDAAIFDTIVDTSCLSALILDKSPEANLDELFRPLENKRSLEMVLSREKAKGKRTSGHASWLRLYAIKLNPGIYVITGGAIKLTQLMSERKHTLAELQTIDKVRNYLAENGIFDIDGLKEYLS